VKIVSDPPVLVAARISQERLYAEWVEEILRCVALAIGPWADVPSII